MSMNISNDAHDRLEIFRDGYLDSVGLSQEVHALWASANGHMK